jgi:hypothetical protein
LKFKLDENFDARLAPLFAAGSHDVKTVQDQGMSGEPDDTVYEVCWSAAQKDGYSLRSIWIFQTRCASPLARRKALSWYDPLGRCFP